MAGHSSHEVTQLLQAWGDGDERALEKLTPLVYGELHQLARRYMAGEASGHILQTTALVHEVYLRLVDFREISWQNRAYFFGVCARLMRQILVDFARSRRRLKRGGEAPQVSLDEALVLSREAPTNLLALDEALNALTALEPRKSRVVELRFFGGLSVEETAEVLRVSQETVLRDWRLAKSWLLREMSEGHRDEA
jgi:RNA polymerase sigma factor (TIGR02999 family)